MSRGRRVWSMLWERVEEGHGISMVLLPLRIGMMKEKKKKKDKK